MTEATLDTVTQDVSEHKRLAALFRRIGEPDRAALHDRAAHRLAHHPDAQAYRRGHKAGVSMALGAEHLARRMGGTFTQPDAQAIRDAALDEAAYKCRSFLVGDPRNGVPLRKPNAEECAAAIEALKGTKP